MGKKNEYEIVKFKNEEFELDVKVSPYENTIWLSQKQLSILFKVNTQAITKQLKNIYSNKELDYSSTCSILEQVEYEGNRLINRKIKFYNLDILIFLGFKLNSSQAIIFRKWANKVLKEYLLKGYAINENRVTVSNENYIELRNEVVSINNRLLKIEDKVFDKEYCLDKLFFNGEYYDAYTLIQQIFESANNEIIIIDNYIDRTILDRLVVKKENVQVIIYTDVNTSKLSTLDIKIFNNQYGLLNVLYTSKVHDRFIIIDRNKLYHLGYSIKDLGKKIFSIIESDSSFVNLLLKNL